MPSASKQSLFFQSNAMCLREERALPSLPDKCRLDLQMQQVGRTLWVQPRCAPSGRAGYARSSPALAPTLPVLAGQAEGQDETCPLPSIEG